MRKVILGILAVAVIGFGVWKYQNNNTETTQGKPTIKIGAILPVTGDNGVMGKAAKNGAIMAIDKINQNLNNKYNYKLIVEDINSDTKKAPVVYNKLKLQDNIKALTTFQSGVGLVLKDITKKDGIIHISSAADNNVADNIVNFNHASDLTNLSEKLVKHLNKNNYKTISLVTFNHAAAEAVLDVLTPVLEKNDIKVLSKISFNPTERNLQAEAIRVANDNPDVVFVYTYEPNLSIFSKELKNAGYNKELTTFYMFSYSTNKELFEGNQYIDLGSGDKEFEEEYVRRFNLDTQSSAPTTYDNIMIIYNLFEKNDEPLEHTKGKIQEILSSYQGPNGKLYMNNKGVIYSDAILKTIKNGKSVMVEE